MFKYPAKNVLCAVEPTELWMSHNDTRHLTDSTQGLFDSQVKLGLRPSHVARQSNAKTN